MAGDIHIHYHFGGQPDPRLAQVLEIVTKTYTEIMNMSGSLDALKAAQAATDAAMEEAVGAMNDATAKIEELAGKIASAGTDPSALKAIVDDLNAHATTMVETTDKLQAAVAKQNEVVASVPDPTPPANPNPEPDAPVSDTPPAAQPV